MHETLLFECPKCNNDLFMEQDLCRISIETGRIDSIAPSYICINCGHIMSRAQMLDIIEFNRMCIDIC